MWKWIVTGVVLALIAIWAIVSIGKPREVETGVVRKGTIEAFVEERAKTRVPRIWTLAAPFDGRVLPIDADAGTPVKAGQVVARMEMDDLDDSIDDARARVAEIDAKIKQNNDARLENILIEQAAAVVTSMDRTVDAAEEQTRASGAKATFFEDELKRRQGAYDSGAITETELNRAKVDQVQADVDLRSDTLTLRATQAIRTAVSMVPRFLRQFIDNKALSGAVLEHERTQAKAQLDQLLADRKRGEIVSPVDGVVVERLESSRRYLSGGTPLLDIASPSDMEVEIEMLTDDAAAVKVGDQADVFGAALGKETIPATVSRIYPEGFKKISSLGVEQQRVLVILAFDDAALAKLAEHGRTLGLEYRVRARVFTDEANDALVVPRSALFRGEDGGWQVFVVHAGLARLADVDVGILNDESAQITRGVEEGERVILVPPSDLGMGERVEAAKER